VLQKAGGPADVCIPIVYLGNKRHRCSVPLINHCLPNSVRLLSQQIFSVGRRPLWRPDSRSRRCLYVNTTNNA